MHRERVLESMICAGNTAASPTAPCNGNLGGGLYCLVGGVNQLTGTLSFGLNCGLLVKNTGVQ
jgi:trypsin